MLADGRNGGEELEELHREYRRTGSPATRSDLVTHYEGFAYAIAARFGHRGEAVDDLRQVAAMALVVALDRYDPDRGVRFTSYAGRCIAGELKRHFRDRTWSVRVGRSGQERYLALRSTVEQMAHDLGRSPTVAEIAAGLDTTDEDILATMAMANARRASSLDAPARADADRAAAAPAPLAELGTVDPGYEAVERRLVHRRVVRELLGRLGEDDRRLVELYYVDGHTQAEVARLTGSSQVSVSRRLGRIIERLRGVAAGGAWLI